MDPKISKIKKQICLVLDEKRYEHTEGVMYMSAALAMRYGEDMRKAMLAGLLHDCAKCIPSEEKIQICKRNQLDISDVEQKNPGLLHAKLGALLAETIYEVKDPDILQSIASHTTGRPGMSLLEKIIYIADYLEPGRAELPNMAKARSLVFRDIDECLYQILKDSLDYLKTKHLPIDVMTEETYLYYKEVLKKREEDSHGTG